METNDSHSTDFEQFPQWRELLDLTYAAWRVSDVAVEHTFLKNKIKQFAADILFAYAQLELAQGDAVHTDFARKVRAQIAALSLAQRMSSANNLNFIVLKNKYKKLQGEFMPKKTASEEGPGSTSEDGLPAVALAKNGLPAVALAKVGKELSLTQSFGEHASSHKNTVSRSHLDTHQQRNKPSRQTLLNDRQTKIVNFFSKKQRR